jgi:hypothetical protein
MFFPMWSAVSAHLQRPSPVQIDLNPAGAIPQAIDDD